MSYQAIGIGIFVVAAFLVLPVSYKFLVALVLMTNAFDMLPQIVSGWLTWDFGAALLLITAIQLIISKRRTAGNEAYPAFVAIMALFWLWMFVPLIWSIGVYQYPIDGTLKYSRHMIVGYLTFFVALRLFRVRDDALETVLKGLYWLTFALMLVCVAQFILRTRILFGLYQNYAGITRYLPLMLPFCLLNVWHIFSKAMTSSPVKVHEVVYAGLGGAVLIMTFTRGLYLSALAGFVLGVGLLVGQRQVRVKGALITSITLVLALGVVGVFGGLDLASARLKSGAEILAAKPIEKFGYDTDTFSGRLRLARERIEMVAERNPIVGYGFLNEDDVWQRLRNSLRYGSIIYSPEMVRAYRYGHPYVLALHSADISWGDLVLNTGFVGLGLFVIAIFAMIANLLVSRKLARPDLRHWRLAFFLQSFVLLLTTLNSNAIVVNVQIFAFMLAGVAFSSISLRTEGVRNASFHMTREHMVPRT